MINLDWYVVLAVKGVVEADAFHISSCSRSKSNERTNQSNQRYTKILTTRQVSE
jgi:hypothetical protein